MTIKSWRSNRWQSFSRNTRCDAFVVVMTRYVYVIENQTQNTSRRSNSTNVIPSEISTTKIRKVRDQNRTESSSMSEFGSDQAKGCDQETSEPEQARSEKGMPDLRQVEMFRNCVGKGRRRKDSISTEMAMDKMPQTRTATRKTTSYRIETSSKAN